MIAAALLMVVLSCPLAEEIADTALTRMIYLDGEFDKTTSNAEKATLATEIVALDQLLNQMNVWQGVNNCEEQGE